MANPELVAALLGGEFAAWREQNLEAPLDLNHAHLEGVDLSNLDLVGAYLIRANLSRAFLIETDLAGAQMDCVVLSSANLHTSRSH